MNSREGVIKGDPLDMVAYSIGFLPLTKQMKVVYPDVTQPCYKDGASEIGTFNNIGLYFNSLRNFGPGRGYYLEPSKSVIIVHTENLAAGKYFGLRHGFNFFTGARYLGSFIGDGESKCEWLKYRTSMWEKNFVRSPKRRGNTPWRVTPW